MVSRTHWYDIRSSQITNGCHFNVIECHNDTNICGQCVRSDNHLIVSIRDADMDILILIRLSSLAHCIHYYSVQCIGKTVNVKCEPTTANREKGKKCCCNIRTSYLYIYYAYLRGENGKKAAAATATAACVGETVISLI